MGILDGITVLDFTQFLSGPTCTMILSDMGAEVIKIERPNKELSAGPYLGGERTYDLSVMRGKKSVTINMKDPKQRAVFFELAKRADLVVENFKPGTMDRMGVSYEEIKKVNPEILFASISGYGQYGPLSGKGALDLVIQAAGGLMSVTGEAGKPPLKVGISAADLLTGLYTTVGVLAMLYHKKRTGKGQRLDMAMMDVMTACMGEAVVRCCATGEVETRNGNTGKAYVPDGLFRTADGFVAVTARTEEQWQALCGALELPGLARDPRFSDAKQRLQNKEACYLAVAGAMEDLPAAALVPLLEKAGVPVSPVRTIPEVAESEQVRARNMLAEVEHPTAGKYRLPNTPLNFSKTPNKLQGGAPILGADTREVLRGIGYADKEIDGILAEQRPLRKMFPDYPL